MAKDCSFDIVSQVNLQEVDNALNQAVKEIDQRFDFKGSHTTVDWNDKEITLNTSDDFKIKSVVEVIKEKLVKREISIKALEFGKIENALGGRAKQVITIKQGIDQEQAKILTKLIKDSKIKVQAQIQGDAVRVSGKNKDDLQQVIQLIKNQDLQINLQFVNYR